MTADAWITLAVLVVLAVGLASGRVAPSTATLGAVGVLLLVGVIDQDQAFSGFSNSGPITVGALYVIAGAARTTGALSTSLERILPRAGDGERRSLFRLVAPVAAASAFVPNTPLVSVLAPRLEVAARRAGKAPSRYLMPLSYAAVAGGVITILGTSTNVVLNGVLRDAGETPFAVFDVTRVGLPVGIVSVAYLTVVSPLLLKARSGDDATATEPRTFTTEVVVTPTSTVCGRGIGEAGLRDVSGLFLAELIRGTHVIPAVGPDEVLEDGDILVFVGDLDRVVELQQLTGLAPPVGAAPEVRRGERFYQAVVAANGELSGNTLKATDFRRRFGAAVIAVHREGQPLAGRLGDLVLRAGDLLLVVSDDGFEQRARATADLLIATPVGAATPTRRKHARVVELVVLAVVVLSATNVLDLTEAAIAGAGFLVATRILTPGEARRSLDIEVLVTIAASISLGTAVASTGLAETVADGLVGSFDTWGHTGVILGVLLATMLVTEVASNNAAAVLVFPIALEISLATGIPLDALAMAILIGASCSYLTPIGYQTNLMVWGMGGYRFGDFARLGAPLTLLTILTTIIAIPLAFEI